MLVKMLGSPACVWLGVHWYWWLSDGRVMQVDCDSDGKVTEIRNITRQDLKAALDPDLVRFARLQDIFEPKETKEEQ